MKNHFLAAAVIAWVSTAMAAEPSMPIPPASNPPAPTAAAIPAAALADMVRRELGDLYQPQLAGKLSNAHALLEKYFISETAAQRAQVAKELAATGIDPNILGRLARIRLNWPQLEPGVFFINERMGPHHVLYFIGIPNAYDRARPWPLVIKLPDAHAFITNPPPNAEEVVRLYSGWIKDELKGHPDAVVLIPLLNLDELYGPSYPGMNSVIQPLLHVFGRVNVDPARVYMLGHAMAGHAVWNLALHYPTWFAAINPMSGGAPIAFQVVRIPNLRNIYAVVWHDEDDAINKVALSREVVKILQTNKYDVDYEETHGVGHAPSDEISNRLYTRMRSRTRELYPKQVVLASNRPDTLFNRNDWVQVYQQLTTGPEERVRFTHGTGWVRFNQNSYKIAAAITGPNHLEIRSANVESMRFYLNDQMVDFSKPLAVTVNGKERFNAMLKPSVDTMLADQMFLGRGWRYYTAYVDVDFGGPAFESPTSRPTTKPSAPRGVIEIIPENGGPPIRITPGEKVPRLDQ